MAGKPLPIRVLLVDDEVDFLVATTPALERRGFAVTRARDGTEALAAVRNEIPDVVVLDVRMPGLDGVEVFRHLKKIAPDVPVVMLTGHGNVQQAFETSRDGVFEYLTKPCDIEHLARVLRRAVEDRLWTAAADTEEADGEVRLLFVDDESDFVEALAPALRRRGIHVTTASNGETALVVASSEVFDVALIDMRMPGMDGLTLLERLRALNAHIEVIVLTGHPSVYDAVVGMKSGAFDFLTKPQPVEVLVQRIRAAFARQQQRLRAAEERAIADILDKQPD